MPFELARLSVPPLLLQPLVENGIKHGLEPKLEGGSVTVKACMSGEVLTIDIIDTGAGLTSNRDADGISSPNDAGFGLAQVREPLQTGHRQLLILKQR